MKYRIYNAVQCSTFASAVLCATHQMWWVALLAIVVSALASLEARNAANAEGYQAARDELDPGSRR